MYRKWSLYEGMRWTPYIAARLQTWQDKGLGNLHKLLALTGITLEEAKKQYSGWQAVRGWVLLSGAAWVAAWRCGPLWGALWSSASRLAPA